MSVGVNEASNCKISVTEVALEKVSEFMTEEQNKGKAIRFTIQGFG